MLLLSATCFLSLKGMLTFLSFSAWLQGGLGGANVLECYKMVQASGADELPSQDLDAALADAMRGAWQPRKERFVLTATKEILLGTTVKVGSDSKLLRVPLWGLTEDSMTITIESSVDNRDIPRHLKRMVSLLPMRPQLPHLARQPLIHSSMTRHAHQHSTCLLLYRSRATLTCVGAGNRQDSGCGAA
jgi:hypothetical protein